MAEPNALNKTQMAILKNELSREDLSIFTCVRMARKDIEVGHFDNACAQLSMDLDKLRCYSHELVEIVKFNRGY